MSVTLTADLNDNADASRIVRYLRELAGPYGATVMLVHHNTGNTDRIRGATAWKGDTDWSYYVQRIKQSNRFEIRTNKVRDTDDPPTMTVRAASAT